jgi:hypothetical protein
MSFGGKGGGGVTSAYQEKEMQDTQLARWKRLRGVNIHVELETLFWW